MASIHKGLGLEEKLSILSHDSQYDLACACAKHDSEHRKRSKDNKWIYPVTLPQGGTSYLFKTLLSNQCINNCKYCPLRVNQDPKRCTLKPDEVAKAFFKYLRQGKVEGLFLSSGVIKSPDVTMEKINAVGRLLRRNYFRGYIHLKIIPGSSDAAIRESLSLANAVSLNVEVPGQKNFTSLCTSKDYMRDIIRPIEFISRLTKENISYRRVKQTTQFVVGASGETDREIVGYSWEFYKRLKMNRIYFSAYQHGLGDPGIFGEQISSDSASVLMREHRLYQVDWLLRKYGFLASEIPFGADDNLSLELDPKEIWAKNHPEFFPVNVNRADRYSLLRVPGLGAITVERILKMRQYGKKIRYLSDLGKVGLRLKKAAKYIIY